MKVYDPKENGTRLSIKCWASQIEEGALEQARNLANLPIAQVHIALMPDAHQGFGMPIGGVLFTDGAVVPNAVGSDVGCGVAMLKTGLKVEELDGKLQSVLDLIASRVPTGFRQHEKPMSSHDAIEAVGADETLAEEAPETPAPLTLPKTAAAPAAGRFVSNAEIIEGEWGGYPAYRCSACPFDSLEREKTAAHLSIHGMTYTQGA